MKTLVAVQAIVTILVLVSFLASYVNPKESGESITTDTLLAEFVHILAQAAILSVTMIILTGTLMFAHLFFPVVTAITLALLVLIIVLCVLTTLVVGVSGEIDFAATVVVFVAGYALATIALALGYAKKRGIEKQWVLTSLAGQFIIILAPTLWLFFFVKF